MYSKRDRHTGIFLLYSIDKIQWGFFFAPDPQRFPFPSYVKKN